MERQPDSAYPKPTVRDWLLVAIGAGFVAMGLLLLGGAPEVAIPCLAFFGLCTVVAVGTVVRKLRFRRLRPLAVEIAGGTTIRPSRGKLALIASSLLGLGGVLLAYWRSGPWLLLACIAVMLAAGVVLALGLVTGRLPAGFLRFEPHGVTIGQRSYALTLPWDAIESIRPGELYDNPVLLLGVRDTASVLVEPAKARPRALRNLKSNLNWFGAHVMIITSHYRIELPFLVKAIEGYVTRPETRSGLGVPRLRPAVGSGTR